MRYSIFWTHPILAALLLGLALPASAQDGGAVYGKVARSVGMVILTTFEGELIGSGSAVTVAPQTMVTNKHVAIPKHRYHVILNGAKYEAFVRTCDLTQDLCLLYVQDLQAPPVEFADASKLKVGDRVYTVGAPNEVSNVLGVAYATKQKGQGAVQLTLGEGLITALRPVDDGNIIQTNAAISGGSSGGGLFDNNGRLVGITTFYMAQGQSLNMALPVNWVARLGVSGAPRSEVPAAAPPVITTTAPERHDEDVVVREAPVPLPAPATPQALPTPAPAPAAAYPFRTWWLAALAGPLLLWFFLRRRQAATQGGANTPTRSPSRPDPLAQRFIDAAAREIDDGQTDSSLWNQAIAASKGNMDVARSHYLQQRSAILLAKEKERKWQQAVQLNQTR